MQAKINDIKPNTKNPRTIKDEKFKKLVKSIIEFPQMLEKRPLVCFTDTDGKYVVIGGNMRLKASKEAGLKELPIILADDWTEEQKSEFIIKDNVGFGEWEWDELQNEWDIEKLEYWGLDVQGMFNIDISDKVDNSNEIIIEKLEDKFIVPPFSVLNTREGNWQERKKNWNLLIGDIGETRDDIKSKVNATVSNWQNKNYTGGVIRENSISILDPVLSEIVNKWFCIEQGNTFDVFAGDTVFGYVSSYMGNKFTGIELRQEQVDINNKRVKGMNASYICDDGRNVLNHIKELSQDLLFSCPPYFDLEIYSDKNNDASNQKEYKDFIDILKVAFTNAIRCLKEDRFAVITVGDIRDNNGFYYGFIEDIKSIFINSEMKLYNELILVQSLGNGTLRANRYMGSRKVVKMHENVLIFYKGNPKNIKSNFKKIVIENGSKDE